MDNVTIYGLATLGVGVISLTIRYCFKSKCSSITLCWGLCDIVRDTVSEVKAEELELNHGAHVKQDSMRNVNEGSDV